MPCVYSLNTAAYMYVLVVKMADAQAYRLVVSNGEPYVPPLVSQNHMRAPSAAHVCGFETNM